MLRFIEMLLFLPPDSKQCDRPSRIPLPVLASPTDLDVFQVEENHWILSASIKGGRARTMPPAARGRNARARLEERAFSYSSGSQMDRRRVIGLAETPTTQCRVLANESCRTHLELDQQEERKRCKRYCVIKVLSLL